MNRNEQREPEMARPTCRTTIVRRSSAKPSVLKVARRRVFKANLGLALQQHRQRRGQDQGRQRRLCLQCSWDAKRLRGEEAHGNSVVAYQGGWDFDK